MSIKTIVATASIIVAAGLVHAQQSDTSSAATSTGNTTSQAEMNRGVPGVDVDVGRNAAGAIDVDTDRNTDSRNVTADRDGEYAVQADRN